MLQATCKQTDATQWSIFLNPCD